MAPRLELFPFRYRDPHTGKWGRARYAAERREIAARYAELELIEPPELREIRSDGRYITPFSDRGRPDELPLEMQPTIDVIERFLAQLFLRRYITYCVGDRRFATMEGAACLCAAIR